jgi:hypothetical protein
MRSIFHGVDVRLLNLDSWPTIDESKLSGESLFIYRRRREAMITLVHTRDTEIAAEVGKISKAEVWRVFKRCIATDTDGRIAGFRACLLGYHIKQYELGDNTASGTAGLLSRLFRRYPEEIEKPLIAYALCRSKNLDDPPLPGPSDIRWKLLDLSEKAGIAVNEYWCGQTRIRYERGYVPLAALATYGDVFDQVAAHMHMEPTALLLAWHVAESPLLASFVKDAEFKLRALALWRAFWEKQSSAWPSTQCLEAIQRVALRGFGFSTHCGNVTRTTQASTELSLIVDNIVFYEVLRASYIYAYQLCGENSRRGLPLSTLLATPLPVIIVGKTTENYALVRWIHQKGISDAGMSVFGNAQRRNARENIITT